MSRSACAAHKLTDCFPCLWAAFRTMKRERDDALLLVKKAAADIREKFGPGAADDLEELVGGA